MTRRSSRSLAGSPLLIGAVTTLIVVVAVFLSYNASNGLPFVPTYDIKVQLPDADSLQVGNDVRIGGTRVGVVTSEAARENPRTGAVEAIVALKLDKRVQPLPADTTVIVRDQSALGEKYLELTPGTSTVTLAAGATLPLAAAAPAPVELDQLLNTFNAPTRTAVQTNLAAYGDALADRGGNLNDALADLAPTLASLEPVARTLAAPGTNLPRLIAALERAAADVTPVAQQEGQLATGVDTTFKALASVAPSLGDTIDNAPPALSQATYSLAFVRPFLHRLTRFFTLLAPSATALRGAAPALGAAVSAGAANLPPATRLSRELLTTLDAVQRFALDPAVPQGLNDLTLTAAAGDPIVSDLAGMQATCNYPTLFFRNLSSSLAEGDATGTWLRALPVFAPTLFNPEPIGSAVPDPATSVAGPNNEGGPASAPANGGNVGPQPERQIVTQSNYLHATPYPLVAAPGQAPTCEAGNEQYAAGQTVTTHAADVASNRDFATGDG